MTQFDPYHKWFGISPREQPPNAYRLLGVRPFETDHDAIESAADQRMAYLRTFQSGPYAAISQKLLNEVSNAKVCLLDPARRQRYDEALRRQMAPQQVAAPGAKRPPPPGPLQHPQADSGFKAIDVKVQASPSVARASRAPVAKRGASHTVWYVVGGVGLAFMVAAAGVYFIPRFLNTTPTSATMTRVTLDWPATDRAQATLRIDGAIVRIAEDATMQNGGVVAYDLPAGPHQLAVRWSDGGAFERKFTVVANEPLRMTVERKNTYRPPAEFVTKAETTSETSQDDDPPPPVTREISVEELRDLALYGGRFYPHRSRFVELYGGNAESEKAVAAGLGWIVRHQMPDGGWSFDHTQAVGGEGSGAGTAGSARNGATAVALLALLGSGHTPYLGKYQSQVDRGFRFLQGRGKRNKPGISYVEPGLGMYSQSLAAIAYSESWGMSSDAGLEKSATGAIDYIVSRQNSHENFGWGLMPDGKPELGSTVACLISLAIHLKSPVRWQANPPVAETLSRASLFLDSVQTDDGARYGAASGEDLTATAQGLLGRLYLGVTPDNPGLQRGLEAIDKAGPKLESLEYTVAGTRLTREIGGDVWKRWVERLRDPVVKLQVSDSVERGSWQFPDNSAASKSGGRLLHTAQAIGFLQAPYRYLPMLDAGFKPISGE